MRVTVVSHLYPAPEHERHLFVHDQVCALRDLGIEMTVLSPTAMTLGLTWLHPRLRRRHATPLRAVRDGIVADYPRVPVLPRRILFDRSGDLYHTGLRRRLPALRTTAPDLLHAHQAMPDGAAALRLATDLGVPLVITVHGADVYQHLRAGGRTAARTRDVLAHAAAVVAVSSRIAASLQELVPEERLFINLNGVVGSLAPVPPSQVLPGRRLLLTVGYLIERKGHAVVLEALGRLRREGLDPVWAIVGDGPLRERLERRAVDLGLADSVRFLGRLPHDQVLALMARADLFVLPSWDEAFGLVYAEAMAQRTPVVGCIGQGLEDFVADGQSGYLVPPRDAAALAAAVSRTLVDEEERRRVGEAGRAAAAGLTWQRNAARQVEIYKKALMTECSGERDRTNNEEST